MLPTNETKIHSDLPTVNLTGVEIFSEGSWNGDKYSGDDLQAIIDAYDKVGFEPTVKAGHADGQDNLNEKEYRKVFGAPALGYVSKLYRKGAKLVADITQVPRAFANLIKAGSYKRVSAEIYWNYKDEAGGKTYPRVLKSVAFLGAEIPALPNLKAVEALFHKRNERVFAYEGGHEYRVYEMERKDHFFGLGGMLPIPLMMDKENGKVCVIKDGKEVGEYPNEEEAKKAHPDAKRAPKENGEKYETSQEEKQMTEQEIQAKLDAMTKDYEAKTAEAVAKAVEQAKAEAETEKKAMTERVALLEKQAEEAVKTARFATIDARVEQLAKEGKITKPEQTILRSIARALPDMATHTYSAEDGKEVKESVIDTVFKLFDARTSLFKEVSVNTREIKSYSDAQGEVIKRANELIAKSDGKLDMFKAYSQVAKDDPELWAKYQLDVKGSH